jgi:antitoxin component of RelBE/YafQ-DinJ toxin-antitoxin module
MIVFDVNRDDNKKNSTVPIRVTEEEKRKLHLAAQDLGLSVSQLIRLSVEYYLYENL